jgi:pimeloyl-ACP methyl ester carboxylesterase
VTMQRGKEHAALRTTLRLEFPNMTDAINHIADDLVLRRWAGLTWVHIRPLLLAGPPGIGKSRFARRVARLLGTAYAELDVAGSSDNRMMQGTARGWKNAQPAWPLLKAITQPTLVVNGGNDVIIYTVNSFILQQHLPNAQLILYPDANHGSQYQFPISSSATSRHSSTDSRRTAAR